MNEREYEKYFVNNKENSSKKIFSQWLKTESKFKDFLYYILGNNQDVVPWHKTFLKELPASKIVWEENMILRYWTLKEDNKKMFTICLL